MNTQNYKDLAISTLNAIPYFSGGYAYICTGWVFVVSGQDLEALGAALSASPKNEAQVVQNWEESTAGYEVDGPFPISM